MALVKKQFKRNIKRSEHAQNNFIINNKNEQVNKLETEISK